MSLQRSKNMKSSATNPPLRNNAARDESKQAVRILVVDDDEPFWQLLCAKLRKKSEWQVIGRPRSRNCLSA
jgi:hypothetical protein